MDVAREGNFKYYQDVCYPDQSSPAEQAVSTPSWVSLQGEVEEAKELLGASSQYLPLRLQIVWDKATKTIYCFCLHIKRMEWKAEDM